MFVIILCVLKVTFSDRNLFVMYNKNLKPNRVILVFKCIHYSIRVNPLNLLSPLTSMTLEGDYDLHLTLRIDFEVNSSLTAESLVSPIVKSILPLPCFVT